LSKKSISQVIKGFFIFLIVAVPIIFVLAFIVLLLPNHFPSESYAALNRIRSDMIIAKSRWEAHKIVDYDIDAYVIINMVDCGGGPITLHVRQGQLIVDEEARSSNLESRCYISDFLPPRAFETISQWIEKVNPNKDYLNIQFDPEYGFITLRDLASNSSSMADSYNHYEFSNFRPTTSPTPTPLPSAQTTTTPFASPIWIDLGPELYIRQIREDAFVITHAFPWPANSLLVEMDNSELVLVGTPYTPAATNKVLDWIERRFGKRHIIAINPGYHVDNLGGNAALLHRYIPVYGSDLTRDLLWGHEKQSRQMIMEMLKGTPNESYIQAHATIPYIAPRHRFPLPQGLRLSFGNDEVQVYYPGPSQAPDKVAVYFSRQKILFGSCMILGGDQIGNTADADMKNWPEAVRKLMQFDAEIVVPGHGERLDVGLLQHTLDLLVAKP
jgi:hypothetical protein